MNQLNLPFALNEKMLLDNFIGSKNQQVLSFIQGLFIHKNTAAVYIFGAKSSGKTHLLQGCAFAALAQNLTTIYLDGTQELPAEVLENLAEADWVCIDNIEYLDSQAQYALFDLTSQIKPTKPQLIFSAGVLPNKLNVLKDLKTRLSLSLVFTLGMLSDEEKISVIKNKMEDKNISIDDKIYMFLFKYYSRDLSEILHIITQLDKTSLQQKHPISIPFIKKTLKI